MENTMTKLLVIENSGTVTETELAKLPFPQAIKLVTEMHNTVKLANAEISHNALSGKITPDSLYVREIKITLA
jgi:hypothetical protein